MDFFFLAFYAFDFLIPRCICACDRAGKKMSKKVSKKSKEKGKEEKGDDFLSWFCKHTIPS